MSILIQCGAPMGNKNAAKNDKYNADAHFAGLATKRADSASYNIDNSAGSKVTNAEAAKLHKDAALYHRVAQQSGADAGWSKSQTAFHIRKAAYHDEKQKFHSKFVNSDGSDKHPNQAACATADKSLNASKSMSKKTCLEACDTAMQSTAAANDKNTADTHKLAASHHRIAAEMASIAGDEPLQAKHKDMAEQHDLAASNCAKCAGNKCLPKDGSPVPVLNASAEAKPDAKVEAGKAYAAKLNELSAERMSKQKPLEAALAGAGWSINDIRDDASKAICELDVCKPSGDAKGLNPCCWVCDVIAPEHEAGETWNVVFNGNDGKLYTVTVSVGDDVKVVGEPKEIQRTSDYDYVNDIESEARKASGAEGLEATWSDAAREAAAAARKSGKPGDGKKASPTGFTAEVHSEEARQWASQASDDYKNANNHEEGNRRAENSAGAASREAHDATRAANAEGTISAHEHAQTAHEHAAQAWRNSGGAQRAGMESKQHMKIAAEHKQKTYELLNPKPETKAASAEDTSSLQARVLVHTCHNELQASGVNPDLDGVRHEVLRLHGVDLTCEQVGEYLSQPLEASGKAAGDASAPLDATGDALESGKTDDLRSIANPSDSVIMYMPGGIHRITPSQGGKPVTVCVLIDEVSAERMEEQRAALEAAGNKPFFSVQHNTQIAAFWPTKFFWDKRIDATGSFVAGVWAEGEWTKAGKEAVEGKNFRTFSPTFFVDKISNDEDAPAEVECNVHAKLNMGALENDPAFEKISPLWAGKAKSPEADATGAKVRQLNAAALAAGRSPSLEDLVIECRNVGVRVCADEVAEFLNEPLEAGAPMGNRNAAGKHGVAQESSARANYASELADGSQDAEMHESAAHYHNAAALDHRDAAQSFRANGNDSEAESHIVSAHDHEAKFKSEMGKFKALKYGGGNK